MENLEARIVVTGAMIKGRRFHYAVKAAEGEDRTMPLARSASGFDTTAQYGSLEWGNGTTC
jgi:hypothetical protein